VAKRDVEYCEKTQDIKASCLGVRARVCMYMCGCLCVRERVKERERTKDVSSAKKKAFNNRVDCCSVVEGGDCE
jgi:hypothetical protein